MFQFSTHLLFNNYQRAYLDDPESRQSLIWMGSTDDMHRRTGRTSILAVRMFREAWQKPGTNVVFEDHSRTDAGKADIAEMIRSLAIQFNCQQFVSVGKNWLVVTEPVEFERALERVITGTV